MVKIISKKDTTIPVKKDAIIVPRPTEFILCNKMSEMTMDEMVNIKSAISRFGRKRGYEKEKEKLFDRMVKVKDLQIKRDQKTK